MNTLPLSSLDVFRLGRLKLHTPDGTRICHDGTNRPIVSSLTIELEMMAEYMFGPQWREWASVVRVEECRLPGMTTSPMTTNSITVKGQN
jgi:hypothetical protein